MSGLAGAPDGNGDDNRRYVALAIFVGLVALLGTIVVVTITSLRADDDPAGAAGQRQAPRDDLPVYWTVKRGDTYVGIAEKTGLTVDDLETFNPRTDPSTIQPGQRLKLRAKVPKRKPRLGPKWATVRTGDSFGSVAAKTGKPITRLQELNPKLKPTALQPGDRIRLR